MRRRATPRPHRPRGRVTARAGRVPDRRAGALHRPATGALTVSDSLPAAKPVMTANLARRRWRLASPEFLLVGSLVAVTVVLVLLPIVALLYGSLSTAPLGERG